MEIWPAVLFYRKVQGQQRGARALSHSFSNICSHLLAGNTFFLNEVYYLAETNRPTLFVVHLCVSFPCSPRRETTTRECATISPRYVYRRIRFVCASKVNTNSGLGSSMCITHRFTFFLFLRLEKEHTAKDPFLNA